LRFRMNNNHIQIGLTSFNSLRSYFALSLKDRNLCCCRYHIELGLLKDSFNAVRKSRVMHVDASLCNCEVCEAVKNGAPYSASKLTYSSMKSMWQSIVCLKEENEEWHNHDCLLGRCNNCGVDKILPLCPDEEFGEQIVSWKCYEDIVIGRNAEIGEAQKKIGEVFKQTTLAEFVQYLKWNL
jgi:hypothetical protein